MIAGDVTLRGVGRRDHAAVAATVADWLGEADRDAVLATYPQVFGQHGSARLFGVFAGDALVSHAAARPVRVATPAGESLITLIGSVATAPDFRRRGLASDLIRHVTDVATRDGCDAAMLWATDWSFYERLGFAPHGQQLEAVIERELDGPAPRGIRPASSRDLPAILQLHRRKPCAVDRDLNDLAVLLSSTPMTTMVMERDGGVVSYACHGKGMDFGGWWHEFGGEDKHVSTLIRGAMPLLEQKRATVMMPAYRSKLLAELDDAIVSVNRGIAALCKPLAAEPGTDLFVDGLDSI